MKRISTLCLFLTTCLLIGCSSDKLSNNGIPCIDTRENYPEKEMMLTEIADVSYVHLSKENDDYLYRGRINCVTENTIVVFDNSSSSMLFFSKDGTPKSRFNRFGQGQQDYSRMVSKILYDEPADEVFVSALTGNKIQVYSSTGEYRRTLTLPQGVFMEEIISFDQQSLLVYNFLRDRNKAFAASRVESDVIIHDTDSSFFLISKTDGEVMDYAELPGNDISLSIGGGTGENVFIMITRSKYLSKCSEGVLLSNAYTDTVYLYCKEKTLTPVFCKTPLVSNSGPRVILKGCIDEGKYQYVTIESTSRENTDAPQKAETKHYMRDKKTGEIFRQRIVLPDYEGKEFYISIGYNDTHFLEKGVLMHFELDLFELKQAFDDNKLSGKLKELVATLNADEDNNVFMLVALK